MNRERGNEAFSNGDFRTAIRWYTKTIVSKDTTLEERWKALSNRSAAFLSNNQPNQAISDARECTTLNPHNIKGYTRLGAALSYNKSYKEAVRAYKKALELNPESIVANEGLQSARVFVLNNLILDSSSSEEEEEEEDSIPSSSLAVLFQSILLETLQHLLNDVPNVKLALQFLAAGTLCFIITNWHWLLLLLLVVLFGIYYIKSENEAITLAVLSQNYSSVILLLLYILPSVLSVIGQVKLYSFIMSSSSFMLKLVMLGLNTSSLIMHQEYKYSFKLAPHIIILCYDVILCQNHSSIFKRAGPLFFTTAAIFFQRVTHSDWQNALRKSLAKIECWKNYHDVIEFLSWIVNYWNEPSSFTLRDIMNGVATTMSSKEYQEFVSRVSHCVKNVKLLQNKGLSYIILFIRKCPATFATMVLYKGQLIIAWPLSPIILVSELLSFFNLVHCVNYEIKTSNNDELDTVSLLLIDSPTLLRIWTNVQAAVYVLECSLSMKNVVSTSCKAVCVFTELYRDFKNIF